MPFCQACMTKLEVTYNKSNKGNKRCNNLCVCLTGKRTSIVVCISPFTAIMIEQQKKFLQKGIKAEFVG